MITMEQLFPDLVRTLEHEAKLEIVNEWAKIKYEAGQYDSLEGAEKAVMRTFKRTWDWLDTGIMPHKGKY